MSARPARHSSSRGFALWRLAAFAWLALTAGGGVAAAQTVNLDLSTLAITMNAPDPDSSPVVLAAPVDVTYRVRFNGSAGWRITVIASGDLTSVGGTIPISALSLTTTPTPPFVAGITTLSSAIARTIASGTGNINPARIGQFVLRFTDSWSYNADSYSTLLTFTLTAP